MYMLVRYLMPVSCDCSLLLVKQTLEMLELLQFLPSMYRSYGVFSSISRRGSRLGQSIKTECGNKNCADIVIGDPVNHFFFFVFFD